LSASRPALPFTLGYRFRIHRQDLPGNPDVVLPKYRKVIFIHGYFGMGMVGVNEDYAPLQIKNFGTKKSMTI